jgi:hypothetical protein
MRDFSATIGLVFAIEGLGTPKPNTPSVSCMTTARASRRTARKPPCGIVRRLSKGTWGPSTALVPMYYVGQGVPQDYVQAHWRPPRGVLTAP